MGEADPSLYCCCRVDVSISARKNMAKINPKKKYPMIAYSGLMFSVEEKGGEGGGGGSPLTRNQNGSFLHEQVPVSVKSCI